MCIDYSIVVRTYAYLLLRTHFSVRRKIVWSENYTVCYFVHPVKFENKKYQRFLLLGQKSITRLWLSCKHFSFRNFIEINNKLSIWIWWHISSKLAILVQLTSSILRKWTIVKESSVNNLQIKFYLRPRSYTARISRRLLEKKKHTTNSCCVGSRTEIFYFYMTCNLIELRPVYVFYRIRL